MASERKQRALASTAEDHATIAAEYINGQRSSVNEFPVADCDSSAEVIAHHQAIELTDMARAQAHLALATYLRDEQLIGGARKDRRSDHG